MSSAPDPTKEVKITNSAGAPIVVLVPTVSDETQDANGTMVYDQDLELLTAVEGGTAIPASSTKTFVLDQTYDDPDTGKPEYSTIYDLLPSTANWYLPVANIGVMQSFKTPPSYPAQTVTAASAKAFRNAATFVQTISAYPTSALATSYQKALTQASGNASGQANGSPDSADAVAKSVTDTVNAFFKSTKTYQDVTLEAVVAVQSSYGTFPFVWAEYATGTTVYYLYSSNGTATSFVGTISLAPPASLKVAVANAGYTCTFTPAADGSDTTNVNVNNSAAKSLTYAGGLFVDDANSDLPQVAVKGTFQIKSLFTGKAADTQIITVLTGTVSGSTCIGFDSAQLSSDPNSAFWDTLFHPKNSAQVFQSVMEIGGALMLLVFVGQGLYGIYKWARGRAAGKQPTTKELLDEQVSKLEKSQKDFLDALDKRLTGGQGRPPADADAALSVAKEQTGIIADNQSAIRLENGLDAQAQSLEEMAEFAPEMTTVQLRSLESIGSKVRDSSTALSEADPLALRPVVAEEAPKLLDFSTSITSLQGEVSSVISESAKASIEANTELVKTASTEAENIQETDESLPAEENPTADEPIFPEL
jgi:hypothetical protein